MKITHIGIWTKQLEVLRSFYTTYFQGKSHAKYINPKKGFESYMLHFEGGCTLEIMSRTDVDQVRNSEDREFIGLAHLAFSTGSKDQVDRLTERLRQAGYKVIGEPRTTGDGLRKCDSGPGQQPDRNQCLTDQIPIIRMPQ